MDNQFTWSSAKTLDYEDILVAARMHHAGRRSRARVVQDNAKRSGDDPASGIYSGFEPLPVDSDVHLNAGILCECDGDTAVQR